MSSLSKYTKHVFTCISSLFPIFPIEMIGPGEILNGIKGKDKNGIKGKDKNLTVILDRRMHVVFYYGSQIFIFVNLLSWSIISLNINLIHNVDD